MNLRFVEILFNLLWYLQSWKLCNRKGMDQKKRIDLSKISNIFENMSYGENNYDTAKALVSTDL